ncbi:MAG: hypothetical protein WCI74_05980 [Actinomycetes bacterium]
MRRSATRSALLIAVLCTVAFLSVVTGSLGLAATPATAVTTAYAPLRQPEPQSAGENEPVSAPVAAAIEALRTHPPLYNSSHAPMELTDEQQQQVLAAISAARTPIYVAILPRVGMTTGVAKQIANGVGRPGTYIAAVGTAYDAYSTSMDVKSNLTRSFAEERTEGTTSVLVRFCALVGDQAQGIRPLGGTFPWPPVLAVVAVLVLILALYLIFRSPSQTHDDPPRQAPV